MAIENHKERLAYLAFIQLFPDATDGHPDAVEEQPHYHAILDHLEVIWDGLEPGVRNFLDTIDRNLEDARRRVSLHRRLMAALADSWLVDHAELQKVEPVPEIPERATELRHAAVRMWLDAGTDDDRDIIERWLAGEDVSDDDDGGDEGGHDGADHGDGAENGGADGDEGDGADGGDDGDDPFLIDQRNLPDSFDAAAQRRFKRAVIARSAERDVTVDTAADIGQIAYIMGSLIRGSYYSSRSPGFEAAYSDEYNKGFEQVESVDAGQRRIARQVYHRVSAEIAAIKGSPASVQEIAAVSDAVIDLGPVDDDNFKAKVLAAHTDYVAREPAYDSLDLPDIVTDDTAQAEVEPANIRAVAMIYAAGHLESLIQATDMIAQDWTDGYIPVGETASRELDTYVWGYRDRLDASARDVQRSKIADLDTHLLQFCSATSERDRARFLSEYLVGDNRRTSAQPRDAAVRKAARDLMAYASLHGWAYAQSASKRLGNQIRQCTSIVSNPEIQKAYGVQGPWQLVERSHQMATEVIPPVAKERTLASTGKEILDLLATKSKDIGASLARDPLFPTDDLRGGRSIFSIDEYETLLVHVENWLAANGINDNERVSASRISDAGSAPSLPTFGGGGFGGSGFDATAARDQLMQMAATGQVPDVGQINQLFNLG